MTPDTNPHLRMCTQHQLRTAGMHHAERSAFAKATANSLRRRLAGRNSEIPRLRLR
jgi:hypothetical protein